MLLYWLWRHHNSRNRWTFCVFFFFLSVTGEKIIQDMYIQHLLLIITKKKKNYSVVWSWCIWSLRGDGSGVNVPSKHSDPNANLQQLAENSCRWCCEFRTMSSESSLSPEMAFTWLHSYTVCVRVCGPAADCWLTRPILLCIFNSSYEYHSYLIALWLFTILAQSPLSPPSVCPLYSITSQNTAPVL